MASIEAQQEVQGLVYSPFPLSLLPSPIIDCLALPFFYFVLPFLFLKCLDMYLFHLAAHVSFPTPPYLIIFSAMDTSHISLSFAYVALDLECVSNLDHPLRPSTPWLKEARSERDDSNETRHGILECFAFNPQKKKVYPSVLSSVPPRLD